MAKQHNFPPITLWLKSGETIVQVTKEEAIKALNEKTMKEIEKSKKALEHSYKGGFKCQIKI